jgi:hypothetical protein
MHYFGLRSLFARRQKELGPHARRMWLLLRLVTGLILLSFVGALVLGTDFLKIAGLGVFSWLLLVSVVAFLPVYFLFRVAKALD